MILDAEDLVGLNEVMTQDKITVMGKKMIEKVNSSPAAVKNNVSYPYEYLPEQTPEWKIQEKSKKWVNATHTRMTEYIAALQVNSNGETIVRRFKTPSQQANKRHTDTALRKAWWAMSNGNEHTFNTLDRYWWLLLLGILGVIALITTNVFLWRKGADGATWQASPSTRKGLVAGVVIAGVVAVAGIATFTVFAKKEKKEDEQ